MSLGRKVLPRFDSTCTSTSTRSFQAKFESTISGCRSVTVQLTVEVNPVPGNAAGIGRGFPAQLGGVGLRQQLGRDVGRCGRRIGLDVAPALQRQPAKQVRPAAVLAVVAIQHIGLGIP